MLQDTRYTHASYWDITAHFTLLPLAGKVLNLAEDVFKLQHLLDCNILHNREEIEEITSAAVKEEQIEVKLVGIESDWAAMNLVSHDYFCWDAMGAGSSF